MCARIVRVAVSVSWFAAAIGGVADVLHRTSSFWSTRTRFSLRASCPRPSKRSFSRFLRRARARTERRLANRRTIGRQNGNRLPEKALSTVSKRPVRRTLDGDGRRETYLSHTDVNAKGAEFSRYGVIRFARFDSWWRNELDRFGNSAYALLAIPHSA